MAEVYARMVRQGGHVVVAVCDAELLGKTIMFGKVKVKVNESFYKGTRMKVEKALELLKEATIANLMGKNIIDAAVKKGMVRRDAVIMLGDVPHVQIICL